MSPWVPRNWNKVWVSCLRRSTEIRQTNTSQSWRRSEGFAVVFSGKCRIASCDISNNTIFYMCVLGSIFFCVLLSIPWRTLRVFRVDAERFFFIFIEYRNRIIFFFCVLSVSYRANNSDADIRFPTLVITYQAHPRLGAHPGLGN